MEREQKYSALFHDEPYFPRKFFVIPFSSIHEDVDVLEILAIKALKETGRYNEYRELVNITRCDGKLLYGVSFNERFQNQENPKGWNFLRKFLRYIKSL